MIDLERVTYRYPGSRRPALDLFDWHVDAGEFVVVTGPSGCGKSTLIRCLNGLIPHFHGGWFGGRVIVMGTDTRQTRTGELSRLVGFVAQDPETQTVMERVEDEIAFGPENHRLSRAEMRRRVEDALESVGVTSLRDRELVTLSGGERQRVVIAAAMAMQPPVLVLDEPTSQLDPWGAEEALSVLSRLPSRDGTTIVLVEHRLDRVLDKAMRLTVLGAGATIVADGDPDAASRALSYPPPLLELRATVRGFDGETSGRSILESTDHRVGSDWSPPAGSTPQVAIQLEGVGFSYRGVAALERVDLDFRGGHVTALMGRNGSGKTTLLKLINGLLRPRSGRVRVLGEDVGQRAVREMARSVAYAPQNPSAMLFTDTVRDELRFTLRSLKLDGDLDEMLEQFGLLAQAAISPLDLSTGERQRVALAAVLLAPRPVVLLDEPTRGMDEGRKRELGVLLRHLAAAGRTIIVATHDTEFVARTADRVALLERGRVLVEGPMRDVLSGGYGVTTQIQRAFGGSLLFPNDVLAARAAAPRD